MKIHPIPTACSLSLTLALLLVAGCAVAPSPVDAMRTVAYQPVPSPTQIDASVSVEATHDLAPEVRASWRANGHNDQAIELHRQAVAEALTADVTNSGIFARIVPANGAVHPDYIVKIRSEILRPSDLRLRVTLTLIGVGTWTQTREASLGDGKSPRLTMPVVLPNLMAALKADVVAGFQRKAREESELAELAALRTASLAALLVLSDENESVAREHNRALIAAKNQQLPGILRNRKTDELSALVVKIEQTILDLNHECEVAKDRAQQSVAGGGTPQATSPRAQTFLGISMGRLSAEKASSLGFEPGATAVIVTDVVPGGPADKATLKRDDVILSINGQSITSPEGLGMEIQSYPANTEVSIKFRRAGVENTTTATLGVRNIPAAEDRPKSLDELRGLAISYRERIELLKPILTALKEEIANRNR